MSDDQNQSYPVGYKRPPKHSRYQQGQSGNPKGRPRGRSSAVGDLAMAVERISGRKMSVTEGGQKKRVKQIEAIVMRLFNGAVSGNAKDMSSLLKLISWLAEHGKSYPVPIEPPTINVHFDYWNSPEWKAAVARGDIIDTAGKYSPDGDQADS